MRHQFQRFFVLAILCLGFAASAFAEAGGPGVVVEEVGKGSILEKAGLLPGDLLLAWEGNGGGEIRTPFDWSWTKAEQAPRGTVRLRGERDDGAAAVVFEVPRGPWDARVRPRMAADLLQTFLEGRRRIEAGDLEGGVALWDPLAQGAEPDLRSWLLLQISEAWAKGGQGDKARSVLQTALAETQDPRIRVSLLEALGESHQYANQMALAESSFRSALEAGETAWGESLRVAGTLTRLGFVLRLQGRLDEAEKLQARALEIRQRWAPDSLEVTDSLHHLFLVAWERKDLETMSGYARRALDIQERWPPDTLAMADTLNDVGILAWESGRYGEASAAFQRALTILDQRSPGSVPVATTLARFGSVLVLLGDHESAMELLQRALAIREKLAPESPGTAAALGALGVVVQEGGDLARAAELFQRALAIWEKAAPDSLGVAGTLDALGTVARLRGDLDEAWSLHRRAMATRERLSSSTTAYSLVCLGRVAEARGELALALDHFLRAQAIYERQKPDINEALTLHQIGRVYRRMRRPEQAAQYLARAVDKLESHIEGFGGSQDQRAIFRSQNEDVYQDAVEIELERGHGDQAFHLLERSRARSFLALLSERPLAFSEVPATLERSRRDNAARYDQTLGKLAQWTPAAGEAAREALQGELSRLRRERDEIAGEIHKASPRLAELRQPQPLDVAAARKVLDPGTLALSYSVGKEKTALFAVTREGGLRVEILPLGEESLRRDVASLLERIQSQEAPTDLARSLYRALIGPVADLVESSERVLILPDGPLHRLPFGALIRDKRKNDQYLAEWKPLHTALSLTVYGTIRATDRKPGAPEATQLVAFGDPRYPKDLAPAEMPLRGFDWTALPYSRREVERIAGVYPGARLYLGEEATEERAKSLGRDVKILHFATHGHLDDRTPLDSALVLTVPEGLPKGRDNGLLQVWEIFESVRLDADLVVLSACESALGREQSGEGLIGLTRAFQYAGAHSVVATLWDVADQVSAELMARFYRHLAAGLSKDEALRAAQIELIRQPVRITTASGQELETEASAPFFWAAFQLFGDWR